MASHSVLASNVCDRAPSLRGFDGPVRLLGDDESGRQFPDCDHDRGSILHRLARGAPGFHGFGSCIRSSLCARGERCGDAQPMDGTASMQRCGVPLGDRSPLAASNRSCAPIRHPIVAGGHPVPGRCSGPLASGLAGVTLLSYLWMLHAAQANQPPLHRAWCVSRRFSAVDRLGGGARSLDSDALALFAIVFLWQFPHFMAIAWMYRDDYDRAGYLVLPRGHARVPFVVWQTTSCRFVALVAGEPASGRDGQTRGFSMALGTLLP